MKKELGKRILFIEKLTLLNFLFALVGAKRIQDRFFVYPSFLMSIVLRVPFISRLQRQQIRKIVYADFPGSYFTAEEEGYQTGVDSVFDSNSNNLFVNVALTYCTDPLFRLALKKEFFNRYTSQRIKTFTLLKYLAEQYSDADITFIPSDSEQILPLLSPQFIIRSECISTPRLFTILGYLHSSITSAFWLFLFPFILISISAGYLFRGFDSSREKITYDWAFDNFNNGINFHYPYDFFFIFDYKKVHPKKTLHVIRNRFDDSDNARKTRAFFDQQGYPYIEHDCVRICREFYIKKILGKFLFGGLKSFLQHLITANKKTSYLIPSLALMKMTIDSEIFYNAYNVKVFIARDEYSPFHIVRTLVARANGCSSFGFSHGDDCHHTSALNYIVFDSYALWGEYYKDHLKKSLHTSTAIIGAGIYGLDKTFFLQSRNYIPEKYRGIKQSHKLLGIFGSSFSPELYITRELTLHFYKTVLDLTEEYTDYYRIIKPKGTEFNDPEFQDLIKNRKRVIIENSMWTYRLLACLDTLICINVTSIGLEGLVAGKKVFYYDVSNNREHHAYSPAGGNLVAFDEAGLKNNLNLYFRDGKYIPAHQIMEIVNYHGYRFDGKVVNRLRSVCRMLLEEKEKKSDIIFFEDFKN